MTKFEELILALQTADRRGNFVLSPRDRKILLEGIKALQAKGSNQ
jgi:hypothetical protein